ncbi:hypothetical protein ACH5RR_032945 [Cinchona calisaya]|uniref:Uncharacterized protein n=1 Tax=Cinchona calisaya TaxID=153742 RepID=A0ABD2YKQ8_9GENT
MGHRSRECNYEEATARQFRMTKPQYGLWLKVGNNDLECRNEIQALSSGFTYVGDRPDEEPIAEMVGVKFTEQTTVGPEVQQEMAVPSNLGAADDIFLVEVELGEEK